VLLRLAGPRPHRSGLNVSSRCFCLASHLCPPRRLYFPSCGRSAFSSSSCSRPVPG
jgi:hypothetical protein